MNSGVGIKSFFISPRGVPIEKKSVEKSSILFLSSKLAAKTYLDFLIITPSSSNIGLSKPKSSKNHKIS